MRLVRTLTLTVLCAGLLAPARPAPQGDADLAARVRLAADALLAEPSPGSQADTTKHLTDVVGILSTVADQGGLPAPVRTTLSTAHARLKSGGSLFDPAVTAGLGEAYASLHEGRGFAFPAGVSTIAQAKQVCRREIDRATAALDAGRKQEAAKGLLEFLLLVTTPMEAH